MQRPGIGAALVVSLAMSAAATAAMYAGAQLFHLTFAPFALVDWLARAAPGGFLTFATDSMVGALQALQIADLSTAAKLAEKAMGVSAVVTLLTVLGTLVCLLALRSPRSTMMLATIAAALTAAFLVWIVIGVGTGSVGDAAWTTFIIALWGGAIGWVWSRLLPTQEPGAVEAVRVDRRRFLITIGEASAAITVVGATVGLLAGTRGRGAGPRPFVGTRGHGAASPARRSDYWSSTHALPNASATVQPVPGTRPELTPVDDHYRIDINTVPPDIDGQQWRLRIKGLVRRPAELTIDQIRAREALHQFITLACISNPIAGSLTGTTRWSGVPLGQLLDELEPASTATHLVIRSADGFDETLAIDLVRSDPRIMLTYDWDGLPLPVPHGYPLRAYIPDRYGMKQPKWIESIEVVDQWRPGYWVRRGWDREAHMKATSVIDVVGANMMNMSGGPDTVVPIGGIAHAGARGISRVEVRMDDGPWEAAQLRQPLSPITWVIWRYEWPFHAGEHTFTVRCVDGAGQPQITSPAPPHPSGATGLHSKTMTL